MNLSRRSFLSKLTGWLSVVAVGSAAYPFVRFVFSSQKPKKVVVKIPLSQLNGIVSKINNPPMYIVKTKKGWIALDSHCTHMGCIVNYDPIKKIFQCPCHGSEYNLMGINIRGPTKRPLFREPVRIRDGRIVVDYVYYKIP